MLTKPQMSWPGIDRQHPLARGLVGCWPFWEGAGSMVSDVVNANHGTLTNMDPATDWVGTKVGVGLDFDGSDDEIRVTSGAGVNSFLSSAWTLLIVFLDDTPGASLGTFHRVLSLNDGTNNIQLGIGRGSGSGRRGYVSSGTSGVDSKQATDIVVPLGVNTLAATYDGSSVYGLYLNGAISEGGTALNAAHFVDTATWYFGERGNGAFMIGQLMLVLVYNRALAVQAARRLSNDPFAIFRIPSIARRFVTPSVGFIPYPNPRYAMTGGIQPMTGGLV